MEYLSNELASRNWNVQVLACSDEVIPETDESIPVPKTVEIFRAGPSTKVQESLSQRIQSLLIHLKTATKFRDGHSIWLPKGTAIGKELNPDLILASGPPFSGFLLGKELAQFHKVPLVLDYRDPWTFGFERYKYKLHQINNRRLETDCLKAASLVTSTSPVISLDLTEGWSKKVATIFTGASIESDLEPFHGFKDRPYIVYLGSLKYQRSIKKGLLAIKKYNEQSDSEVSLVYAGSHGGIAKRQAEEAGCSKCLVDLGHLSRQESLQLLKSSLASYVIAAEGFEYMIPGKIFDAVAMEIPIIMESSPESASHVLVRDLKLGVSLDSSEEFERALPSLIKKEFDFEKSPPLLSAKSMTDLFESLFEEVL